MIRLYILLGGNLGDKSRIFSEARDKLNKRLGKITAQSSVYETEPWGFESSDLFWNQVLEITTKLSPEEVLLNTQQTEIEMGRIRKSSPYNSRIIDIDILFYGNEVINQHNLIIPHPRLQDRKFALIPLCEMAPDLVHPVFRKSIRKLIEECTDQLKVEVVPDAMG
ncbi:MAG: 2-amino-4-hydroxy-6-hydroxymethyldihydropteridine diphosphokinase [Bacteroidia bacterium]|jgi:2-amino-4-hydroxy-6-hydroxymethyldihydropteridine diphosphokinase